MSWSWGEPEERKNTKIARGDIPSKISKLPQSTCSIQSILEICVSDPISLICGEIMYSWYGYSCLSRFRSTFIPTCLMMLALWIQIFGLPSFFLGPERGEDPLCGRYSLRRRGGPLPREMFSCAPRPEIGFMAVFHGSRLRYGSVVFCWEFTVECMCLAFSLSSQIREDGSNPSHSASVAQTDIAIVK